MRTLFYIALIVFLLAIWARAAKAGCDLRYQCDLTGQCEYVYDCSFGAE